MSAGRRAALAAVLDHWTNVIGAVDVSADERDEFMGELIRATTPPDHPRPELGGGDEATDDETKERA